MRREGRSGLAILVFGTLLESARKIAERLDATLVNMRFVKPLDERLVMSRCGPAPGHRHHRRERRHGRRGLERRRAARFRGRADCRCTSIGIPDRFIEHGSRETCLAAAGLDLAGLTANVEHWWNEQTQERIRSIRSV